MYPEFIAIYVGLGVLAAILIAVLVLVIVTLKKVSGLTGRKSAPAYHGGGMAQPSGNVVFCRNCATQFDARERVCPKCGTPR